MRKEVIIYTKPGCPFSKAAKDDFQKRGIKFKEISISENPQAVEEVTKLAGERVVPVIVEGGKVKIGFNGF
jgi:glutaredoxin